jgi:hypothetical protein
MAGNGVTGNGGQWCQTLRFPTNYEGEFRALMALAA